ncbi:MAG: hypothetical protein FVQ80_14740 [Planctomycetes bacterium]|nr:hypothetical protein [Planctomycetota bacterium]
MISAENNISDSVKTGNINTADKQKNNYAQTKISNSDMVVGKKLLQADMAENRHTAKEVSTALSLIQSFSNAVDTIIDKLGSMETLAKKAAGSMYSATKKEQMQKDFKNLATEINNLIKTTKYQYDNNKILSPDGKSISIPIDNDRSVDIFAINLGFDAEGLDLTTNAKGALAKIQAALEKTQEYNLHLSSQQATTMDATQIIDSKLDTVLGFDSSGLSSIAAEKMTHYVAEMLAEDADKSMQIQANADAQKSSQLLIES